MVKTSSAALAASIAFFQSVNAFWRMPCGVIQTARIDPIVNPGTVGAHVHKIAGPPGFSPNSTFDTLFNTRCTSCQVQADKSAYWTPLLYYEHSDGTFEEVPAGGMTVYYLGRGENATYIQPFPKGFRMLSGNPSLRAYDNNTYTFGGKDGVIYTGGHCQTGDQTCVGGKFVTRTRTSADPPGPVFTGRPVSDRVSFACLDSSPLPETPSMSRTACSNGLRAQIQFPSCWDGVNNYLPGNSHVDYLSQIDNGVCSPSHPVLLPHLFFEVLYGVANIHQDGGRFVFAMGDPTGYGFHGDFLNAWDPTVLSSAIKQCINANPSGVIDSCAPLAASSDPNSGFNCPTQSPLFDEAVTGLIGKKLPGCNNVVPGPAPASAADLNCPAGTPPPPTNSSAAAGSGSAPPSFPRVDSVSSSGWKYAGCFNDDAPHSFATASTTLSNLTNAGCQAFCAARGFPLAATEYSRECYCAYALNATANTPAGPSCAAMVCAGNSSEYCGGPSLLSVYNSTTYAGSYNPTLPAPGADAGSGYSYVGCVAEPATGARTLPGASTVSAANMTNDACAAFCAAKGFGLFGTEYARECYCGSVLAAGSQTGQSGCNMYCSGAAPQSGPFAKWANICGGSNRLTVWKNNNVGGSGK